MLATHLCHHARASLLLPALLLAASCGSGSESGDGPDSGSVTGAQPESWLETESPALDLAADGAHLYFSDGARLRRAPLAGGLAETLHEIPSPGENYLWGIVAIYVGATHVALVSTSTELVEPFASERQLVVLPKQGGPARTLASSADTRAFLGAFFHGQHLYFSSFTAVLRVPIEGGEVEFVAESPGPISYWIYSPLVIGDQLIWAEDDQLFRMQLGNPDKEGESLASLPGVGKIVDQDGARLVVALSPAMAFQEPANAFVTVDTASGAAGTPVALGRRADDFAVADPDVWVASWTDGLFRHPLAGGPPTLVLDQHVLAVTAADSAVFAATETEIWRVSP